MLKQHGDMIFEAFVNRLTKPIKPMAVGMPPASTGLRTGIGGIKQGQMSSQRLKSPKLKPGGLGAKIARPITKPSFRIKPVSTSVR